MSSGQLLSERMDYPLHIMLSLQNEVPSWDLDLLPQYCQNS